MRIGFILLVAAPLLAVVPVQAQERGVASAHIAQGNYSQAESKLLAELRIYPGRPELLLNLATVYAKTGRVAEARSLYTKVLSRDDVLMDVAVDRTAGSHALAQRGLRRLDTVQFTAR